MNANATEQWAERGAVALKAGAFLSVLALVAVVATNSPVASDEASIEAAAAASVGTPLGTYALPPANAPASDAKPYYFPSEYQLNAPEPGEPVPTF